MGFPDTVRDLGVVRIADAPPPIGINGDLWYNPTAGSLSVSNNGQWFPVSGAGSAQVFVGDDTNQPLDASVLIWIDTTDPANVVAKYLIGGAWVTLDTPPEVFVGDDTNLPLPAGVTIWIDTTDPTNTVAKYLVAGSWVTLDTPPEVFVGDDTNLPLPAGVTIWVDTTTADTNVKYWVNGAWVNHVTDVGTF